MARKSELSLGNDGGQFLTSSKAAFKKPSDISPSSPIDHKLQGTSLSLGQHSEPLESSTKTAYKKPPNITPFSPAHMDTQSTSWSLGQDGGKFESESKYQQTHGITTGPTTPKQTEYYGRHVVTSARAESRDNVLASPKKQSAGFVTSTSAAFPKSPTSPRQRPPNVSAGVGTVMVEKPTGVARTTDKAQTESSDLAIKGHGETTYQTSHSSTYVAPTAGSGQKGGTHSVTEQHKKLQQATFNPTTGLPTNSTPSFGPALTTTTAAAAAAAVATGGHTTQTPGTHNITEQHVKLQGSSFNPITGE